MALRKKSHPRGVIIIKVMVKEKTNAHQKKNPQDLLTDYKESMRMSQK